MTITGVLRRPAAYRSWGDAPGALLRQVQSAPNRKQKEQHGIPPKGFRTAQVSSFNCNKFWFFYSTVTDLAKLRGLSTS